MQQEAKGFVRKNISSWGCQDVNAKYEHLGKVGVGTYGYPFFFFFSFFSFQNQSQLI